MILRKITDYINIESIVLGDKPYLRTVDGDVLVVGDGKVDLTIRSFNLYSWRKEAFVVDKESDEIYRLTNNGLAELSYKGNYLYRIGIDNELVFGTKNSHDIVSLYKASELQWEKEKVGYSVCFNDDFYAYKPSYKSTKIELRNISDYSVRFKYEYDSTYKVGRTLFMNQDILVVPFLRPNPNYNARIIGLDLKTGDELWNFEVNTHEFILSKKSRKLFGLIGSSSSNLLSLEIVDLAKGIVEKSIIKESISTDVVSWNAIVKDGYLFYSDNIGGCKIGVLDLNSKTIVSELELGLKSGIKISEPKIWNNKLFVMDTSKVCHELEISFSQLLQLKNE